MSISKQLLIPPSQVKNTSNLTKWFYNMFRPITRFYSRVKRLLEFVPVIWDSYDWDHSYATGLFAYQLQRMVKYMEKNQPHIGWENDVSRMKTAIELIKRVDDDYYSLEYYDLLEQKYGKSQLDFKPYDSFSYEIYTKFDKDYTTEELEKIEQESEVLRQQSFRKQAKARRVLWKFIEHNLENWWS